MIWLVNPMAYLKFLAFVLVVLLALAIETMSGAFAQGSYGGDGYHRPGSRGDQPWLRSMDPSQSRSYSGYPQGNDARQGRYQGVIEAKRQRAMQQTYASATAAMAQADRALAAGNRQAAWNVLNSARNALEGLQRGDSGNPLWAIGLAELYGCENYPKPDRAQYYIDQATMAAGRGAAAGVGARIARAKSLISFGRNVHKNAIRFQPPSSSSVPDYSSSSSSSSSDPRQDAADKAQASGDYGAAERIRSGNSSGSDIGRYGQH